MYKSSILGVAYGFINVVNMVDTGAHEYAGRLGGVHEQHHILVVLEAAGGIHLGAIKNKMKYIVNYNKIK
jgi:hypothetical protein